MTYELLGVFLGNKCNLSCLHCIPSSGLDQSGSLSSSEINMLCQILVKYKIPMVSFTGGEPLLFYRKQIVEFQNKAPKSIRYRITSNGTIFKTSGWKKLLSQLKIDELRISFDIFHGNKSENSNYLTMINNYCIDINSKFIIEVIYSKISDLEVISRIPKQLRKNIRLDKALKSGRAARTGAFYASEAVSTKNIQGKCPSIEDKVLMYYQGRGFTLCCNNISETKLISEKDRFFSSPQAMTDSFVYQTIIDVTDFEYLARKDYSLAPEENLKCNFCEKYLGSEIEKHKQGLTRVARN